MSANWFSSHYDQLQAVSLSAYLIVPDLLSSTTTYNLSESRHLSLRIGGLICGKNFQLSLNRVNA